MKVGTHFLTKGFKKSVFQSVCFYIIHYFHNNLQNLMHVIINSFYKKCFTVENEGCVEDIGGFWFIKSKASLSLPVITTARSVYPPTQRDQSVELYFIYSSKIWRISFPVVLPFMALPNSISSINFLSLINLIYTNSCASFATSVTHCFSPAPKVVQWRHQPYHLSLCFIWFFFRRVKNIY